MLKHKSRASKIKISVDFETLNYILIYYISIKSNVIKNDT